MSGKEIIKIVDLEKTFISKHNEVTALKNVNLSIHQGEIFGIIGLSGAGKSTLVRCMNFLEKPTTGKVFFDDKDLSLLSSKELLKARQSIGMIFQGFNLLMQRTALQNICFPLEIAGVNKAEAKKRALELLEIVELSDKKDAYPAQLSGGQKQRVAIARALATNPKVLLCDEATSALDPTTTRSILKLLKDINTKLGVTIVIITHEMSVIEEICQRVAIIDHSNIVEVGEVQDIFLKPKSKIARKLIFPDGKKTENFRGGKAIRIVFEGQSPYDPIIANMVLECNTPVNIVFADTTYVQDKKFGHMIIQLPEDEQAAKRVLTYLSINNIKYEEDVSDVR